MASTAKGSTGKVFHKKWKSSCNKKANTLTSGYSRKEKIRNRRRCASKRHILAAKAKGAKNTLGMQLETMGVVPIR